MNAIALLKTQHREVEDLFAKLEDASRGKEAIAEKILRELTIHTAIEERVFYPAVKAHVARLGGEVLESLEEHNVVKWEIASIAMMKVGDERFEAKMNVLRELVMTHIENEEDSLFPAVQTALGSAKLNQLGAELEKARVAVVAGARASTRAAATPARTPARRGAPARGRPARPSARSAAKSTTARKASATARRGRAS